MNKTRLLKKFIKLLVSNFIILVVLGCTRSSETTDKRDFFGKWFSPIEKQKSVINADSILNSLKETQESISALDSILNHRRKYKRRKYYD